MRQTIQYMFVAAAAVTGVIAVADTASAACTRLAFSVNDYGIEGPTKDAKDLLDKYIAKSMAEKGVTAYKTGKKTVNCELFLDFIVFDEHTCKAEATVCWGDSTLPKSEQQAATPAAETKPSPPKAPAAKTTTGSIDKPSSPAESAVTNDPVAEATSTAAAPSNADTSKAETTSPGSSAPAQAAAPEAPAASTEKRVEVYETLPPPAAPSSPPATTDPADVVVAPSAPDRQAP